MEDKIVTDDFRSLLLKGIKAREEGGYAYASTCFGQAEIAAGVADDPAQLVELFGHQIVLYKHLYELSGKELFLELMGSKITQGLVIAEIYKLVGGHKAMLLLRRSDYFSYKSLFDSAVDSADQSIKYLDDSNITDLAEYRAHLGSLLAKAGHVEGGLHELKTALSVIEQDESLPPQDRFTVQCGILMRLFEVYHLAKNAREAGNYLTKASGFATVLAEKYSYTHRLFQIRKLKEKYQIYS